VLALGRHGDYFSFLGLPRRLGISAEDLERRFRALSRQFHPDYFYNASAAERRASLERSSFLNDAYRTLRQPIARLEYLLGLEGFAVKTPEEASKQVPPELLEEVFELNEELEQVRRMRAAGAPDDVWRRRLERARGPIESRREAHERQLDELFMQWDLLVESGSGDDRRTRVLEALRNRVLERNYINNLLAGIEREQ
jgi:molecular chaperone HscB